MPDSSQQFVKVMCPNLACQRILAVPAHARGEIVRCRGCNTNIRIPQARDASSAASAGSVPPQAA